MICSNILLICLVLLFVLEDFEHELVELLSGQLLLHVLKFEVFALAHELKLDQIFELINHFSKVSV